MRDSTSMEVNCVQYARPRLFGHPLILEKVVSGNISVTIPDTVGTIDLSKPFSNSDTSIWSYIPKNGSVSVPTLNDGSIFATNSSLYLFGGAISAAPGAPSVPPPNGIWQYSMSSNRWAQAVTIGTPVQRIHVRTPNNFVGGERFCIW